MCTHCHAPPLPPRKMKDTHGHQGSYTQDKPGVADAAGHLHYARAGITTLTNTHITYTPTGERGKSEDKAFLLWTIFYSFPKNI